MRDGTTSTTIAVGTYIKTRKAREDGYEIVESAREIAKRVINGSKELEEWEG